MKDTIDNVYYLTLKLVRLFCSEKLQIAFFLEGVWSHVMKKRLWDSHASEELMVDVTWEIV